MESGINDRFLVNPDLVTRCENSSFFWTISMSISAKLRDLGIAGLKDKINKLR